MSRAAITEVPESRICRSGCSPDPQPIENFYSRTVGALGVKIYDHRCKRCISAMELDRYRNRQLRSSGKGRKGERQVEMKALDGYDITPCTLCGLRGHIPRDPDRCIAGQERSTGMGSQGADWGAL